MPNLHVQAYKKFLKSLIAPPSGPKESIRQLGREGVLAYQKEQLRQLAPRALRGLDFRYYGDAPDSNLLGLSQGRQIGITGEGLRSTERKVLGHEIAHAQGLEEREAQLLEDLVRSRLGQKTSRQLLPPDLNYPADNIFGRPVWGGDYSSIERLLRLNTR